MDTNQGTNTPDYHPAFTALREALDALERHIAGPESRPQPVSQFAGLTVSQAALQVLKEKATIHAMKTSEVVDALRTGGVEYEGRHLYQVVYTFFVKMASKRNSEVKRGLIGGTWKYRGKAKK